MKADLVIYQRNLFCEPMFSAVRYFQGLGKPFVLDLDDAYPILPWSNPAHAFWIENARKWDPPPLEGLDMGARMVDAVTSPSKVICRDWSTRNIAMWVPNFPQGAWYEDLPGKPEAEQDRVVVGWGGSVSHYDSFWFSGVKEALRRVCERHPEVLVKICGNDARIHLQLPVPLRQKAWQRGVPPPEWPKVVSTFDLGIAPLDLLHPYDARRSWLKGAEYMLAKVPWIGSDGPVYDDLREFGTLVGNTPDEWEEAMEDKLANLASEKEKAADGPHRRGLELTMERNVPFYATLAKKVGGLRASGQGLPGVAYVAAEKPTYELEGVHRVGPERVAEGHL